MDIPPLAFQCDSLDRASNPIKGNTVEFIKESEKSCAFDGKVFHETDEDFAATIEASFTNSNSSARTSSEAARDRGSDKQIQTSAIATLYTFAVREGDEESYLSDDFKEDLLKVKD